MPSFPLSVRPVLAALLTALLLASSVLVSAGLDLFPAARAAVGSPVGNAPAAPAEPAADAPVSVDLVSLAPTALAPGGTLEATLEVTNTSSAPVPALTLELRTQTSRVTDRSVLADWQADSSPDTSAPALARSVQHPQLAPGESVTLTVEASAEELGYSEQTYHWGTRRVSFTVVAAEQPLTALRSFVIWRPAGVEATITQSVLLPVAAHDASAVVTAPDAFQASAESGRLAGLQELSQREDVDWWLDPALLDPPLLPEPLPEAVAGEETAAEDDAPEPVRSFRADPPPPRSPTPSTGPWVSARCWPCPTPRPIC
ncbi:DUF6049 family protein [Brachybacterium sp. UNK5269]|uniref:DUF6049 family protein n=1 Tax=Brachybacterium sp. UNK5269 TaxID=3408576 RepID=UPI003BB1FB2E